MTSKIKKIIAGAGAVVAIGTFAAASVLTNSPNSGTNPAVSSSIKEESTLSSEIISSKKDISSEASPSKTVSSKTETNATTNNTTTSILEVSSVADSQSSEDTKIISQYYVGSILVTKRKAAISHPPEIDSTPSH